jgi:hypothetical protein
VDEVRSYAIVWEEGGGRPVTGQLLPGDDSMSLEGSRDGRLVRLEVFYRDLAGIRVGRASGERLNDRATSVAIFVFSGDDACEAIRRLMEEPTVLRRVGRRNPRRTASARRGEFFPATPR